MSPSVSIESIGAARGQLRINYEYSTDSGEAQVNTTLNEQGADLAEDIFQIVQGEGSETAAFSFSQGANETVDWGITVLIEEDGNFDQQQLNATLNPDGSLATDAGVPVERIGGGGGGGGGGGPQPTPGGGPFGLSRTEVALLGLAAGGVGLAYVRTQ
jgi:hypothetical protein